MNAILLVCVLGVWPELPSNPATAWPELPQVAAMGWPELPCSSSVEAELLRPAPVEAPVESVAWKKDAEGKLVRLPGPKAPWPHQGCLMCLGIHLERTHRIPQGKLSALGHAQWDVLHCNLHNEVAKVAEKKPPLPNAPKTPLKQATGGCSGGACSSPATIRWRGRFR